MSLVIGVALLVLGIAMLFGYRLPFTTPKLDIGERDRTVGSMFVFGIAYAVASIGCTIGLFSAVVLGAFSSDGLTTGITAVGLYGIGMALVVTGLTVTLAFANTALLRVLRRGMDWFEQVAGILLLLTGMYLCGTGTAASPTAPAGGSSQRQPAERQAGQLRQEHQAAVVWTGVIVIVAAVVTALTLQRNEPAS